MIEWAIAWGVVNMGGAIAGPILGELAKGALEDYAKDFFKDSLGNLVEEFKSDDLKRAYGLALKEFLQLVEAELEFNQYQPAQIKEFKKPLKKFVQDERVAGILGLAFKEEWRSIPARDLIKVWEELDAPYLPDEFDWEQISKSYIRAIKTLLKNSSELRETFSAQNLKQIAENTANLAGIQPDFNLKKYAETIQEQHGNLKLDSLDSSGSAYNGLRLWKIFVPQTVRECQEFLPQVFDIPKDRLKELRDRGEIDDVKKELEERSKIDDIALEQYDLEELRHRYVSQSSRSVLEMLQEADKNYVVILGDPGSGKSTLLQYLALDWAKKPLRELPAHPLPLLIELRLYARDKAAGKCKSFLEFLHQGNVVCQLNQLDLDEKLRMGNVLALFDGVDEVFDPQLREEVINDIHGLTNDYPQARVVVTSRWLGYKAQRLRDAEFQHFMLQDFEDEQITTFIERWHKLTFGTNDTEQILRKRKETGLKKAVSNSKAIQQLAVNPLLLTMMAILNRHKKLPQDRAKLYERASELLLHQWDIERNLIDQNLDSKTIDVNDKQEILRHVADYMQASKDGLKGNIIDGDALKRILFNSLKEMGVENPKKVAGIMLSQLRHRNFILCDLGGDNYGFIHRTFLAYFCASSFVRKFEKIKTLTFNELWKQTFDEHWQDKTWVEVLRLISGMIEPDFTKKVLKNLLRINGKETFYSNIFLAAECLSDVRQYSDFVDIGEALKKQVEKLIQFEFGFFYTSYEDTKSIWAVREKAIQTIALVWHDHPETLPWIKNKAQSNSHPIMSQVVIRELAKGWKDDPDTFSILKNRAQHDDHPIVRQAAVQELAKGWKNDSNILSIIQKHAQYDDHPIVRQAAVQELAYRWGNDHHTFLILKQSARHDKDNNVRQAALQGLAYRRKEKINMIEFIAIIALRDPFKRVYDLGDNPRKTALKMLVNFYQDSPRTLRVLQNRAVNDSDKEVRDYATKQLEKLQSDEDIGLANAIREGRQNDFVSEEEVFEILNGEMPT